MTRTHLWLGVAAAGVFATGYWAGMRGDSAPETRAATVPAPALRGVNSAAPASATATTQPATPTDASALAAAFETLTRGERTTVSRELFAQIAGVDASAVPQLLEIANRAASRADRASLREALLDRWATLQPPAAFAWANALTTESERSAALATTMAAWAAEDPRAAIEQAAKISGRWTRRAALKGAVAQWTATDPAAAQAWVNALPPGALRNSATEQIARELCRADPSTALEFLLTAPGSDMRDQSIAWSIGQIAARNSAAGQQALARLPEGPLRDNAVKATIEVVAATDPKFATDYALTLPPGSTRANSLAAIAQEVSYRGADAVEHWLTTSLRDERERSDAVRPAISNLMFEAPSDAARLFRFVESSDDFLASAVGASFAEQDPVAAIAWAQNLPVTTQSAALRGALGVLARTDLAQAVAVIESQPEGTDARQYYGIVAELTFPPGTDFDAVLAKVPAGQSRDTFAKALIPQLGLSQPQEAVRLLAQLTDDDARKRAAAGLAGTWSRDQPAAAGAWISSIAGTEIARINAWTVARNWMLSDPVAAGRWIESVPDVATRDRAIGSAIVTLSASEPLTALEWCARLSEPDKRLERRTAVAKAWFRHDPTAATAWIQQSTLPAEVKAGLLGKP